MAGLRRLGSDEVVACFQELEDPRSEIDRKHPLASVVVIALIAVLARVFGVRPSGRHTLNKKT